MGIQWRIQGKGPSPYYKTKLRPEGPKRKIQTGRPLSQGLDDRPPHPFS